MSTLKGTFPEFYDPAYYELTPQQLAAFRRWCTIALDASCLLSLYVYTERTRNDFLDTLAAMNDRIWLPHQAAYEYEKNRIVKIKKQITISEEVRKVLRSSRGTLQEEAGKPLQKVCGRTEHPFVALAPIRRRVEEVIQEAHEELEAAEEAYKGFLVDDPVRERLNKITKGRIGEAYSPKELESIYSEGFWRYDREQPPGYMDARGRNPKTGVEKYGDLVLWNQVMDRGLSTKRSVLLVTNDLKEDWWRDVNDRSAGPRVELLSEMKRRASVRFLLNDSPGFFSWASTHLERRARHTALEEVKRVAGPPQLQLLGAFTRDFARRVNEITAFPEITAFSSRVAAVLDAAQDASKLQMDAIYEEIQQLARLTRQSISIPVWPYILPTSREADGTEQSDGADNETNSGSDEEDPRSPTSA